MVYPTQRREKRTIANPLIAKLLFKAVYPYTHWKVIFLKSHQLATAILAPNTD